MKTMNASEVLAVARNIADEYAADDLKLTLRQMYYQFVSRGLVESSQASYKRIGHILSEARYDDEFPMDVIEDRGRTVKDGDYTDLCVVDWDVDAHAALWVRHAIRNVPSIPRWYKQSTHVSVWVEKEALAGVFEQPCDDLGVSMFALKGYPSVSALADWLDKLASAKRTCGFDEAVVLYFGDHDPDGLEIPDAAMRSIDRLRKSYGTCDDVDIDFKRIALTRDQIRTYNPPPFPAKETSSRFAKYVQTTGLHDAWELDALDPRTLRELITTNVNHYFDTWVHAQNEEAVGLVRERLEQQFMDPEWIRRAIRNDI